MPEGVRRTLQAAYADEYDPEEEASALAAPAWLDDINWSTDDEGSFRYADDEAGSQEAAINERMACTIEIQKRTLRRKHKHDFKGAGPSGGN